MNYEIVEIKTKRLIMKRGEKKDYIKVYEYDYSKLKGIEDAITLVKQNISKIENLFKQGMNKYFNKIKKAHVFDWIIYKDNEPIGNILTGDENFDKKEIEVSFNMHPSYWGKGYMPEALEGVIEFLFKKGYDNIICTYSDGNKNAKRVLNKLGFKPYDIIKDSLKTTKGNLLDEYKMIMTKDDWFSKTGKITKINSSL